MFIDLDATEDQLDFPVLYTNAQDRRGARSDRRRDPLTCSRFSRRLWRPFLPPSGDPEAMLQIQVTNLDYSDYLGPHRNCARVSRHAATRGGSRDRETVGEIQPTKITKLFTFRGLDRDEAETVSAGDIVAIAGVEGIQIGESITDLEHPAPLEPLLIDEPTLAMLFTVNTSPFAGREGQFVTSRDLRSRLERELLTNVSLRVEDGGSPIRSVCWRAANYSSPF